MKLYSEMTEVERKEVRLYGVTVDQLRETVETNCRAQRVTPAQMANRIISQCQVDLKSDKGGQYDFMVVEDVRQALNRAKFILQNFVIDKE